jgi:hypothetical protein
MCATRTIKQGKAIRLSGLLYIVGFPEENIFFHIRIMRINFPKTKVVGSFFFVVVWLLFLDGHVKAKANNYFSDSQQL